MSVHYTAPSRATYRGRLCRWPEEGEARSSPLTQTSCYTRLVNPCILPLALPRFFSPSHPAPSKQDLMLMLPLPMTTTKIFYRHG